MPLGLPIPSKTAPSIGAPLRDRDRPLPRDPRFEMTAVEFERIKDYVIALASSVLDLESGGAVSGALKPPVDVVATASVTLGTGFAAGQVIGGVTLVEGMRVLATAQATASENGILIVPAAGAPDRAADLFTGAAARGAVVYEVRGGVVHSVWVCTDAEGSDVVGTDALTFVEPPGGGGSGDVVVRHVRLIGNPGHNSVTLATGLENADTFDGETLATNDTVVLVNQTDGAENGPWVVPVSGAPSRPAWFAAGAGAAGAAFVALDGYAAGRVARVTNDRDSDTIGTHSLTIRFDAKVHRGGAAPTSSNGFATGHFVGDLWAWENTSESHAYMNAGEDAGDPVWRQIDLGASAVRALGTGAFAINAADDHVLCHWTGTGTEDEGTVNTGRAGQVTTIILTGTDGVFTFVAGSGVTLEAERGKILETQAPTATTAVTVAIIYLTSTHAVATGGLAIPA